MKVGLQFVHFPAADPEFVLGQDDDGTALRSFVSERSQLRGIGQLLAGHARCGMEFHRHAIAERDRAGLVEQQNIDVAGRFHRASARRENIVPNESIDPADADRAEQSADRRRDQADEERNEHRKADVDRVLLAGGTLAVMRKSRQGENRENEKRGQANEQNAECDFVRRFLSARAFHQADHAVDKSVSRFARDADEDAVAQDARPAGDRAAIAAALANDRRGFARDGRFIDARDAFDDLAVARNEIVRFADDDVAFPQIAGGDFLLIAVRQATRLWWSCACGARLSACALPRPSAIASAKLAKRSVNQSQSVICRLKPCE